VATKNCPVYLLEKLEHLQERAMSFNKKKDIKDRKHSDHETTQSPKESIDEWHYVHGKVLLYKL
jgi:hypothetical protein